MTEIRRERSIARTGITAPIASATSVHRLTDLIAATRLKRDLSSIERLNQAGAGLSVP